MADIIAVALGLVFAVLMLTGGLALIFRERTPDLEQQNRQLLEQNEALTTLLLGIHGKACDGRSLADPVMTVIADDIERTMRTETRFVLPPGDERD